jgi:hypothetical protein
VVLEIVSYCIAQASAGSWQRLLLDFALFDNSGKYFLIGQATE